MENKVAKLNNELKSFCDENKTTYLCNNNIDEFCLGIKKLNPNKKGKAFLAKNFIKCISETIWPHPKNEGMPMEELLDGEVSVDITVS